MPLGTSPEWGRRGGGARLYTTVSPEWSSIITLFIPSSSVPNLSKRSLLFVGSGWVKGDSPIPFLFRLRFSSALRDGIGVFKPSSPSTKKKCFFTQKYLPAPQENEVLHEKLKQKTENRPTYATVQPPPRAHRLSLHLFSILFLPLILLPPKIKTT